ncbi:MAG TPA: class I SAM-dependent methyltransferase [Candidatus Marinimicrobia bacterium]|nr:class I SAM-dependent methyltransferase [Candidatus Neomarinimicrobiota bacterium]HRS51062.1 class I SAM-dependent methyltransferase [Candidatus Neomarinimicrobiota bacterium]HRU92569.1 class I SAM-dependent methyltransferase [Candidatus Neomarinimicrobiota bacterium]
MTNISPRNLNFHKEQYWTAANFLNKYIGIPHLSGLRILEVGSAEGGALNYFANKNNQCYGLEYSRGRLEIARELNKSSGIVFIHGDITEASSYENQLREKMDLIICCDVIEHIANEKKAVALKNMQDLLQKDGRLYISFPPKYSPFAGHQQGLPSWLHRIPYLFLLPDKLYSAILKSRKIRAYIISNMLATKHSRLSINQFEKMVRENGFRILKKDFFLIRPRFKYHYGIPYLRHRCDLKIVREIFSLGAVYLLQPCEKN